MYTIHGKNGLSCADVPLRSYSLTRVGILNSLFRKPRLLQRRIYSKFFKPPAGGGGALFQRPLLCVSSGT